MWLLAHFLSCLLSYLLVYICCSLIAVNDEVHCSNGLVTYCRIAMNGKIDYLYIVLYTMLLRTKKGLPFGHTNGDKNRVTTSCRCRAYILSMLECNGKNNNEIHNVSRKTSRNIPYRHDKQRIPKKFKAPTLIAEVLPDQHLHTRLLESLEHQADLQTSLGLSHAWATPDQTPRDPPWM